MNNRTENISFTGIHVGNANILNHNIKIYQLTEKDKIFINKLKTNINLRELSPSLNNYEFEISNSIMHDCFDKAILPGKKSYLLTCNKKPCGIIVNSDRYESHFVEDVCTWPTKQNQKVPFGAQTLFATLFHNFMNSNAQKMELVAARFKNNVNKYERIGFSTKSRDCYSEYMQITRDKVHKVLEQIKNKLNLTFINNNKDINLLNELHL